MKDESTPAQKDHALSHKNDPADWAMYNHGPAGWRFNATEKTLSVGNVGKIAKVTVDLKMTMRQSMQF